MLDFSKINQKNIKILSTEEHSPNYYKIQFERLLLSEEEWKTCTKIYKMIEPSLTKVQNPEELLNSWKDICKAQFPEATFADLKYSNTETYFGKVCKFKEGRPKLYLVINIEDKTAEFVDQAHFDDKGCEELKFS